MRNMTLPPPRNYGVDLFKIFSMFLVTVLHILGQGGILDVTKGDRVQYESAFILEIFSYCAVNCFAIASGYVQVNSRFRYTRIIPLHLQVLFYTIGLTAFAHLTADGFFSMSNWIAAFTPLCNNTYWYYTAYFGLFFLIPHLNELVHRFEKKKAFALLSSLLILFSCIPCISRSAPFSLNDGYSLLWLCTMYLLGAYLAKHHSLERLRARTALLLLCGAVLFTWLSRPLIGYIFIVLFGNSGYHTDWFVLYTSPTIVLTAVALLALFLKIKLRKPAFQKAAVFFSTCSFSVYLIHVHWSIFASKYFADRFIFLAELHPALMVLGVLGCALAINLLCYAIDTVRYWLFQITGICCHCEKLAKCITDRLRKKKHTSV